MWKPYITKFVKFMLCMVFLLACTISSPTRFPRDTSIEADAVTPDFVSILGDDWYADEAIIATVGDDFKSRPASLDYHADQSSYHESDSFPLIRYTVLIYDSGNSAYNRYLIQKNVLFYNSPTATYLWYEYTFYNTPNADEFYVACMEVPSESVGYSFRCKAIFLYERTIAILDLRLVNHDVQFLTQQQMLALIQAIDIMFAVQDE